MKNLRDIAASLAPLRTDMGLREYRSWAGSPSTAKFLSLTADLLMPPPLPSGKMGDAHEVINALVRREMIETFVDLAFRLDRLDIAADDPLPEPDYGADEELRNLRAELAAVLNPPSPAPAPVKPTTRRKTKPNEQ